MGQGVNVWRSGFGNRSRTRRRPRPRLWGSFEDTRSGVTTRSRGQRMGPIGPMGLMCLVRATRVVKPQTLNLLKPDLRPIDLGSALDKELL